MERQGGNVLRVAYLRRCGANDRNGETRGCRDRSHPAGNEFTDTLPAQLTVGTPTASSGTVSGAGVNPVTWNGTIPPGGTVTITIPATVAPATVGQTVSNQGTVSFDANRDFSNDTTGPTNDPATAPPADPTQFVVGGSVLEIPTLSEAGLALLVVMLSAAALTALRRRNRKSAV